MYNINYTQLLIINRDFKFQKKMIGGNSLFCGKEIALIGTKVIEVKPKPLNREIGKKQGKANPKKISVIL